MAGGERRTLRARGLNPRALGTNPRAVRLRQEAAERSRRRDGARPLLDVHTGELRDQCGDCGGSRWRFLSDGNTVEPCPSCTGIPSQEGGPMR